MSVPHEVTRLLDAYGQGDREAMQRLLPYVYDELRAIAQRHLRRERGDHTLNPTALVHEVYFRLVDQTRKGWNDRVHFYAVAATAMRRILVDYARARRAEKRGGGVAPIPLEQAGELSAARADELVLLDDALERLAHFDARQARVVECRYFAGLTIEETAEALGVSPTTVKHDWALAKAWLYRDMKREIG